MSILTRSEDVFSLFPCQAHPSQSVLLNAEAFADLDIFGRGHAIINEWFRAWIEPAVQDFQALVRGDAVTFQRTAELLAFMQQFLQFRTVALRELAITQVDVDHFRAREAALLDRIGSYWAVFYHLLERATLPFPPALDRAVKLPLKAQTEYRNSLVAEWFFDAGLDLDATKGIFDRDAFQDLKRKISRHYSADRTVGGWDKRRFWLIFSTGLTKFITMGEKYWNYLVGFDGWTSRFTLFNRALLHEGPLDAVIPYLRCIHDPITLGGAFAVGAAVAAFFAMSRSGFFGPLELAVQLGRRCCAGDFCPSGRATVVFCGAYRLLSLSLQFDDCLFRAYTKDLVSWERSQSRALAGTIVAPNVVACMPDSKRLFDQIPSAPNSQPEMSQELVYPTSAFRALPCHWPPTAPVALDEESAVAVLDAWTPVLELMANSCLELVGQVVYCPENTSRSLAAARSHEFFFVAAHDSLLPNGDPEQLAFDKNPVYTRFADIVYYMAKCSGEYWRLVYDAAEAVDGGGAALQGSVHRAAYVSECFDERVRSWFASVGLDMHTTQQKLVDSLPRGGDAHLYWRIFLSGLARALAIQKADYAHMQTNPLWSARFTFFSKLLRDAGIDMHCGMDSYILDPVTLGGAYGARAPYRDTSLDIKTRTDALALDIAWIIRIALCQKPVRSERMAEQAVAIYLSMPML
ncbi:hypothetical protein EV714DRAFT_204435 [Schizophyllum commune]